MFFIPYIYIVGLLALLLSSAPFKFALALELELEFALALVFRLPLIALELFGADAAAAVGL